MLLSKNRSSNEAEEKDTRCESFRAVARNNLRGVSRSHRHNMSHPTVLYKESYPMRQSVWVELQKAPSHELHQGVPNASAIVLVRIVSMNH